MSDAELEEHRRYLADERKVDAYRAALAEVVAPDDVVLDLGAGTGLLGCLACDAGAASVVAVDRGDIIDLARRISADNGYGDRIRHVQALSTAITLDTPADVAVCDQIGGLVHDAGVLSCFADARARLLAPNATLVPAAFRISLAPVTFPVAREAVDFWASSPAGLDVGAAHEQAVNTEWKFQVPDPSIVTPLAPGATVASFASDHDGPIRGTAALEVTRAGLVDGFVGWFDAELSPSVSLTNHPWSEDRFDRWCNFYAVDEPIEVLVGDEVEVRLDLRPRLGVVSWSTTCRRDGATTATSRNSTFRGSFLAASTVEGADLARGIRRGPRIDALRTLTELVDGTRSTEELAGELEPFVGRAFTSRQELERFVRQVADLVRG